MVDQGRFATAVLRVTIGGFESQEDQKLAQSIMAHLLKLPGFSLSQVDLSQQLVGTTLHVDEITHGMLVDASNKPEYRIKKGKHKGKLLSQAPRQYIAWLAVSGCPEDQTAARRFINT